MTPINFEEVRRAGGLELLARQMVEGFITGLHKSPYHGFSVEFAEHRLYNEGQSTRHIDWKVFARTDRLYTKQYEEETNLRCLIALDCSPSMYYPKPNNDKIRFSIYCAAALAHLLSHQRDAVGLALFSDQVEELTTIKSTPAHLDKLFKLLDQKLNNQPPLKTTRIANVLHTPGCPDSFHCFIRFFVIYLTTMEKANNWPNKRPSSAAICQAVEIVPVLLGAVISSEISALAPGPTFWRIMVVSDPSRSPPT